MTRRILAGSFVLAAAIGIGAWPVTTRFGVNYHWSSARIPLYEKAVNFLSRDLQARRLAGEVTAGAQSDEEQLLRIFAWVGEHIRQVPPGFPVVDDHVWHVIVRGYGAHDQKTEVFALLASYSGLPATAISLPAAGTSERVNLALVRWGVRTLVCDVDHRILFRNVRGEFADVAELMREPQLIEAAAPGLMVDGVPYAAFFAGLDREHVSFARMERQKLWPRIKDELGFGLGQ